MIPLISVQIKTSKGKEVIPKKLINALYKQGYQINIADENIMREDTCFFTPNEIKFIWLNKSGSDLNEPGRADLNTLIFGKYKNNNENANLQDITANKHFLCHNDHINAILKKAQWQNYIESIVIRAVRE